MAEAANHDTTGNATVIGVGTKIKGEMSFEGTARILGEFEGRITSPGEVQVGESATCKAAIEGNIVVVDGVVEGNVTAKRNLLLNPSARVAGDVVAGSMTVVEGASLVGHCRIGADLGAATGGKPRIVVGGAGAGGAGAKPAAPVTVATEMETSLAGLESKIAGLGRGKTPQNTAE